MLALRPLHQQIFAVFTAHEDVHRQMINSLGDLAASERHSLYLVKVLVVSVPKFAREKRLAPYLAAHHDLALKAPGDVAREKIGAAAEKLGRGEKDFRFAFSAALGDECLFRRFKEQVERLADRRAEGEKAVDTIVFEGKARPYLAAFFEDKDFSARAVGLQLFERERLVESLRRGEEKSAAVSLRQGVEQEFMKFAQILCRRPAAGKSGRFFRHLFSSGRIPSLFACPLTLIL